MGQELKPWLQALTSPVRCCCYDFFLHTKQGAPKQKAVVIFSRSSKSTHRSKTICPLMNKSSSCGGKHPSLIPRSLIFPRIFCRKRPLCPVLDVRRYVAICWNSRLASFLQKRYHLTPNPEFQMCLWKDSLFMHDLARKM